MAKFSVRLANFGGGLNSKVSPWHVAQNQATDLSNVVFSDYGAVQTRPGNLYLSNISYGVYNNITTYKPVGADERLIVLYNNSMLKAYTGDVSALAEVHTALTIASSPYPTGASDDMRALQYLDRLYYNQGSSQYAPRQYTGTSIVRWGMYPPPQNQYWQNIPLDCREDSFGVSGPSGTWMGPYRYAVLWEDNDGNFGDYGVVTTEITTRSAVTDGGGGANVRIFNIPEPKFNDGVKRVWLVRNKTAMSGVYYFVPQSYTLGSAISGVWNSALVDNWCPDSALVDLAPTDNGTVPNMSCFVQFQGRVFGGNAVGANPTRLYYSEVGLPNKFPQLNYIDVGTGDGHAIRAIGIQSNGLVIAKNDGQGNGSMYFLYMPDNVTANWTLTKLDSDYGAMAVDMPKALNGSMYLNRFGVYQLTEAMAGKLDANSVSSDITPEISALNYKFLNKTIGLNFQNKLNWAVPDGGQSYNTKLLQYDYYNTIANGAPGSWSIFDATGTNSRPYNMKSMTEYNGRLLFATYIPQWAPVESYYGDTLYATDQPSCNDENYNGNGQSTIHASYTTPLLRGMPEHENNEKVWRWVYLTMGMESLKDDYMALEYAGDLTAETPQVELVTINSHASCWGIAEWGQNDWGGGQAIKKIRVVLKTVCSKTIQLRFRTYSPLSRWKVYDVEVFYNLRAVRP
jgi:hypothetical protein